jgi:hypothetical protein
MPSFQETLEGFLDEHKDLFSEDERGLMTHGAIHRNIRTTSENRELLSVALTLYAAKLDQKQAESNERHAKAMKGLERALLITAAVQTVALVVSVLHQLGVL